MFKLITADLQIENIDGKVWNKENVFENLLNLFSIQKEHYYIGTNSEGPDVTTSGIEDIIIKAAKFANIQLNTITIVNGNLLKSAKILDEQVQNGLSELIKYKTYQIPIANKDIKLHFSSFVGRSNWARLWLSTHLSESHNTKSLITYHWSNRDSYHRDNLGLEELIDRTDDFNLSKSALDFLSSCPRKLSDVTYPIYDKESKTLSAYYDNIFLDIVVETYFSGNTFFITEKTWRPIETMTPFLVFSSQGFLKNLRQLGFETFNNWWPEEYDKYSYHAKVPELIKIIDEIGSWSIDECKQVYEEMKPILLHNKNVLQTLTWDKICNTKFYNTESNE